MRLAPAGKAGQRTPWKDHKQALKQRGFTLIELMVVIAIVAIAAAVVSLGVRTSADTLLQREAERLAAALDVARARARISGAAVQWRPVAGGFRFDGLADQRELPATWLDGDTTPGEATTLVLGPEPVGAAQRVALVNRKLPGSIAIVSTDGLRPFTVRMNAQSAMPGAR